MTFTSHSRLSAMASFVRPPTLSVRDWKSIGYVYIQKKIAEISLKIDQGHRRWMTQFNRSHKFVVYNDHITMAMSCIPKD